jgi:hypothetical protein
MSSLCGRVEQRPTDKDHRLKMKAQYMISYLLSPQFDLFEKFG